MARSRSVDCAGELSLAKRLRTTRLTRRHAQYGKPPEAACANVRSEARAIAERERNRAILTVPAEVSRGKRSDLK